MPVKMSKEDIERAWAERADTIEFRYRKAFPNAPLPQMYWQRGLDGPQLESLMERAIAAGRPLTPKALREAQGHGMPPPDATDQAGPGL
jgi:hypothetical protein